MNSMEKQFSVSRQCPKERERIPTAMPRFGTDITAAKVLSYIEKHGKANYHYVAKEHFERLFFSARFVESVCRKTDALLDIGSFPYFIPAYLSLKGFENLTTADIARPDDFPKSPEWKFRSFALDIEEQPFPLADNSLDMIVLLEVFEHLYRRPNHAFREFARVLRPGGRIFMSTPNGAALYKYWGILFKQRFGSSMYATSEKYEKLGHFSHIREYSIQEIREYLKHFGFCVSDVRYTTFGKPEFSNASAHKRSLVSTYFSIAKALPFIPMLQQTILLIARNMK